LNGSGGVGRLAVGTALNRLNSIEQPHRRNTENSFNAEDAKERRDAEDYIQKEIPSRNAPGLFWGTAAREASRGFPSGRPKKEHGSWWADQSRCAVLCVSAPLRSLR
jgi:hypothetical protein